MAAVFTLEADVGFSMADEGYLWYGAIQTARGEVPLRDFQSYEPGRYYWIAAWFRLFGNEGVLGLRAAVALFQAIGVCLGLLALARVLHGWGALAAAGLVLTVWVHPRYRAFEATFTLGAVFFGLRLLERPSRLRHFAAGAFVGLAAFFGRNHGVYGLVAFALLFLAAGTRAPDRLLPRLASFAAGVAAGSAPLWLMLLAVPGFLDRFVWVNVYNIRVGNNLPVPIPWPWTVEGPLLTLGGVSERLIGWFCVMGPLLMAASAVLALRSPDSPRRRVLLAAVCVGAPYLHHLFSRADLVHLASSIHPLLVAVIAAAAPPHGSLDGRVRGAVTLAVLLAFTLLTVGGVHPFAQRYWTGRQRYIRVRLAGDTLWTREDDAHVLRALKSVRHMMEPAEEVFVAPLWTSTYPLLKRRAPVWRLSFALPDPPEQQHAMLRQMEARNVCWALLCDTALDGFEERRFSNSYRVLWEELTRWQPVPLDLPAGCQLLHKGGQPARLEAAGAAVDEESE